MKVGTHELTLTVTQYESPMVLRQNIVEGSIGEGDGAIPVEVSVSLGSGHIIIAIGHVWFTVSPREILTRCHELAHRLDPEVIPAHYILEPE